MLTVPVMLLVRVPSGGECLARHHGQTPLCHHLQQPPRGAPPVGALVQRLLRHPGLQVWWLNLFTSTPSLSSFHFLPPLFLSVLCQHLHSFLNLCFPIPHHLCLFIFFLLSPLILYVLCQHLLCFLTFLS